MYTELDLTRLPRVETIETKCGSLYVGQVTKCGMKHGIGVMIYDDGRQYEGAWYKDKRYG